MVEFTQKSCNTEVYSMEEKHKNEKFQLQEYSEQRRKEMEKIWSFLSQNQEEQHQKEQNALKKRFLKRPNMDLLTNPEYKKESSEISLEQRDARIHLGQYLFKIGHKMEESLFRQKMELEAQHEQERGAKEKRKYL